MSERLAVQMAASTLPSRPTCSTLAASTSSSAGSRKRPSKPSAAAAGATSKARQCSRCRYAAERIALEIDQVAAEIRQAVVKRDELEQVRTPMSTSKKFVQQTMDEMTGLIENAALDTRVAWVRDLLDRVTVDGREEHAVAIWRTASDDGVNRSDSVSSWLRR